MSMMIGAHPDIAVPLATTGMWFDLFEKFETKYHRGESPNAVERLVDDTLAHERIRLWQSDLDRDRIVFTVKPGDFGSLVAAFHSEYARQQGKPIWGNIDIANLDNMQIVNRWFSNARFLHIVRDGRDVALSNQTMPYGPGNIAECADAWVKRLGLNLAMGEILGSERYFVFQYESLILHPQKTLKRICDFLKVPFSDSMLRYGETVDSRVPQEKQWLWPELKSPPQASKVKRWANEMSVNQRIVFEWTAGDLLRRLNYEAYDSPPSRLGAHLLELAYFIDRGHRTERFLNRLGIKRRTKLEREASVRKDAT